MLVINAMSMHPPVEPAWQTFSKSLRYEILDALATPLDRWHGFKQRWGATSKLSNDLDAWRNRALTYAFRWHTSRDLRVENTSLRALLGMHQRLANRSFVAHVVWRVEDTGDAPQALINQGSMEGVKPGMAVLSSQGVLGHVLKVRPHTATILTLMSRQSTVPVVDATHRHHFLLKGQGGLKPGKLVDVADSEPLRVGDALWTSGLGGIYPPHVLVAHVESLVHQPSTSFAAVRVRYAASWNTARYVLLVDVTPPPPPSKPIPPQVAT